METEAETGGMRPPAQGRLEPPELEKAEGPSLEPVEGARPWDTWTSDIWFPTGEDEFVRFTPSANRWRFVTRKIQRLNVSGRSLGPALGAPSSLPGQARRAPRSPRGASRTCQSPAHTDEKCS